MAWSQVGRYEGIFRLDVGESKNADSRIKNLDDELKKHFKPSVVIEKKSREFLPSLFLNEHGTDRVKRFDKAWKKACGETGIGVKIFHDFRRTAVGRNMVRSGVLEREAMLV